MRAGAIELSGRTPSARRALGVAASIVFHVAVLAALGLSARNAFRPRFSDDGVPVELVRPTAVWTRLKPPPPARARVVASTPAIRPHATPAPPPASAPAPYLVPPAPPQPAPTPASPSPAPQPARAPLLGLGDAMQKVLGCNDSARGGMTEAQAAACDKRIGEDTRATKRLPLMIPPDKKAAWDREMWKRHRPQGDPMVPCTGPGSNFGFACIPDKQRQPPPDSD